MNEDPLSTFAADLRSLRTNAGNPSFRALARKTHYSASTLSTATAGRSVPSLSVVRAYVRACGADADEWTSRWRQLIAHRTSADTDTNACAAFDVGTGAKVAADMGVPGAAPPPVLGAPPAAASLPAADDSAPLGSPSLPSPLPGPADHAPEGSLVIQSEEIRTADGMPVPMPPSHHALPAPIPVPPASETAPWPSVDAPVPPMPTYEAAPPAAEETPAPPGVPAPVTGPGNWPAVPETQPTRVDDPSPGAAAETTVETAVDITAESSIPDHPAADAPGAAVAATMAAGADQRPPGTDLLLAAKERPSRPKPGPRHRAPRPPRRWRGKILTLTVAGVAIGGVVIALSHDGSGRTARASANSSGLDQIPTRPLIGPGCGTKPESSAFPDMAGDGWTDIGGGPAQCGGHSLASQTAASTTAAQDTYTWSFQTQRSARCMARLFISSADPSPGVAHYDVSSASQRLAAFTIDQAKFKGRWVAAGPFTTFDGKLQIKLTDKADRAGARHHVNASAATIGCVS